MKRCLKTGPLETNTFKREEAERFHIMFKVQGKAGVQYHEQREELRRDGPLSNVIEINKI